MKRLVPLSVREYYRIRALAYPQFQKDASWIFRAVNIIHQHDTSSALNFTLQQMLPGEKCTVEKTVPTAKQVLTLMDANDEIGVSDVAVVSRSLNRLYKGIGGAVRGTAVYWNKVFQHLTTMVSCLGGPQFFITLSSRDLYWLDLFHAINPNIKTPEDVSRLTHQQRVEMLNEHG
jgi:hypothetical protein